MVLRGCNEFLQKLLDEKLLEGVVIFEPVIFLSLSNKENKPSNPYYVI